MQIFRVEALGLDLSFKQASQFVVVWLKHSPCGLKVAFGYFENDLVTSVSQVLEAPAPHPIDRLEAHSSPEEWNGAFLVHLPESILPLCQNILPLRWTPKLFGQNSFAVVYNSLTIICTVCQRKACVKLVWSHSIAEARVHAGAPTG